MPSLDPEALKLPTFRGGTPIVLSDGRAWEFPTPTVACYYPRRHGGGGTVLTEGFDFGPEYDRLTDAYADTDEADGVAQLIRLIDLAYHLLARNYALDFDAMRELLRRVPGDEASREMFRAIEAVAFGRAPKAIPGGDAPASSPPG